MIQALTNRIEQATKAAQPQLVGRVARVVGLNVEVNGVPAAIGDAIQIDTATEPLMTEVVALRDETAVCMPLGELHGIRAGAPARSTGKPNTIRVGYELLGRVLNGLGRPIDGGASIEHLVEVTCDNNPPHPLRRAMVDRPLPLGVRVLDTLTPCGRGQRLGIMSGSGVGKSSLLSMIARGTEAEVSVLALIGERGREVREFIENDLGPEGLARSVVIVATSDEPALVRLRAAFTATRIAEWFRDNGVKPNISINGEVLEPKGADVVLMMDSLTRFCMAQREVGLSSGEPPATRGYPPSVFAMLPRLLERAGAGERGSITGLYTVLVEGDDMNEPIGDASRSILDGHIVLSRRLASAGHFPCVEVLDSVSRVAPAITTQPQRVAMTEARKLMAAYRDAKDLIEIGAYVSGTNPTTDRAIGLIDPINEFLRQDIHTVSTAAEGWGWLGSVVGVADTWINEVDLTAIGAGS
jgi:flagellum-specific ATP synthase